MQVDARESSWRSGAASLSSSDIPNANSMAGVGIFFQQDADTSEVFVKTIVSGGSADRSGVIRVSDVVVRVDHESVEGQLLSSLRSRILGRQGSYVTLGFRRKEGNETTYYDVPLMRGSSEFFDSMKSNQPLQDEIERLKRANAGLEAQRARDASELQRYRSHMERQREDFDRKFLAMDQALSDKDAELTRLQGEISRLLAATRSAQGVKGDLEKLREAYDRDQKRVEEKEIARQHEAEAQRKMFEEERSRYESTIKRLELDLATHRREVAESEMRENRMADELRRRVEESKSRKMHDSGTRARFEQERRRLQEAQKINETIGVLLRDIEPNICRIESDLFVKDSKAPVTGLSSSTSAYMGNYSSGFPGVSARNLSSSMDAAGHRRDDGNVFMA